MDRGAAERPVPVSADAPPIGAFSFEEEKRAANPMSAEAAGEIAVRGAAAAAIADPVTGVAGGPLRALPVAPGRPLG